MKQIVLKIGGMSCSACSGSLEKFLNKQEGIKKASVNLLLNNATVLYDEQILSLKDIDNFVSKVGFECLGPDKEVLYETRKKRERIRLLVLACTAILSFVVSMWGRNLGLGSFVWGLLLLFLATTSLIVCRKMVVRGLLALVHLVPNMESLIAIGSLSAYAYSVYRFALMMWQSVTFDLFFDSVSMILLFVSLGIYVENLHKDKLKEAMAGFLKLTPERAFLFEDGKFVDVPLSDVCKGDLLYSKAGGKIAADGMVEDGVAYINQSFITGENEPVRKEKGAEVLAGSLIMSGDVKYKVTRVGRNSFVSSIVHMVTNSMENRPKLARIADVVSFWLVWFVLGFAILAFVAEMIMGNGVDVSVNSFVCVLVVACPCALGLATPMALMVANNVASKKNILIKNNAKLEVIPKVDVTAFDKTGTLTSGKQTVVDCWYVDRTDLQTILSYVMPIEQEETHPVAMAVKQYGCQFEFAKRKCEKVERLDGMGVYGVVEGRSVCAGNEKLMEKYGINIPDSAKNAIDKFHRKGDSIVMLGVDHRFVGILGIADQLRANAKAVVSRLAELKIKTLMISGDNAGAAAKVASEIGMDEFEANVLPAQKSELIDKKRAEGHSVMMVGDGVNDAPSMLRADVSVAMGQGTDIAVNTADVVLLKDKLESLPVLFGLSKLTMRIIKQNLFWAFFYNVCMLPVAAGFFSPVISLNPAMASGAMFLSSAFVVLNSLSLYFRNKG